MHDHFGLVAEVVVVSCPDPTPEEEEKESGYNTARPTLEGRNRMPLSTCKWEMAVPWKIACLFVCHCCLYVHFRWSVIVILYTRTISDTWTSSNYYSVLLLVIDGYVTESSGMSYCNQTPFPPREGWLQPLTVVPLDVCPTPWKGGKGVWWQYDIAFNLEERNQMP